MFQHLSLAQHLATDQQVQQYLLDGSLNLLAAIVILVIGWTIAGWLAAWTRRILSRSSHFDETLKPITVSRVRYTVLLVTLVALLFTLVVMFSLTQNRWKIDDVLGVWPLHGLCGAWGGIACGIFGAKALGGLGGVSFASQLAGTLRGIAVALGGGFLVYGALKAAVGLRLSDEEEFNGADLSIHKISSTPFREEA